MRLIPLKAKPQTPTVENRVNPLEEIQQLVAEKNGGDAHTVLVVRFSLMLFDGLVALHSLDAQARQTLEAAAWLHDIGYAEGYKGHHKAALQFILNTPQLSLDNKQRLVIGSIARYHRKALPSPSHDHYAALTPVERQVVCRLASLLRVADGLDRSHRGRVNGFTIDLGEKKVTLHCQADAPIDLEVDSALKKADLFEKTFGRKLKIKWDGSIGADPR